MSFILIAAIGKNNELGYENRLIWSIPDDLKFFREMTDGKTIIMGRKTFESLGRILPNRKHVVITTDETFCLDNIEVCNNIDLVIEKYANDKDAFIIGGAKIYDQFIDIASTMYLTEVEAETKRVDTYFPKFNKGNWDVSVLDEKYENDIKYKQLKYTKKR